MQRTRSGTKCHANSAHLTSGGGVVNEVKWAYNDFNQPVTEYQNPAGAVNLSTTPKIQYAYEDGSANTIRRKQFKMVSGTEQNYHYATGLPDALSRPSAIREGSTDIATYRYLGLGSFVGVDYPGPAVALTYQHGSSGDGGDQYTGLDRFGRVIDLRWNKSSTALVSSQYGYDRNSNQRWRKDAATAAASVNTEDQVFWYDGLQQVYQRQRGTLTPSTPPYTGITGLQQTEAVSFDETGNWLTDYNSTGGPLNQSRTHNKANEIASLSGPTGVVQPVYSAVGNSTTVPQPDNWAAAHTLKWDAWNRLVEVPTAGTVYQYDALFRRVRILAGGADHHYSFTDQWQVSEASYAGGSLIWRAFWGLRDLNDIIKRDGVSSHGTSLYGLRDKMNFVVVTDTAGNVNLRIAYDAFGQARYLTSAFAAGSNTYYWNFLFHGYEWDAQSGFLAVRYRTYHPTLGRWLSRDPIGEEGGLNLYAMVGNNGINNRDLLGLSPTLAQGLNSLKKLEEKMKALCDKCCPSDSESCKVDAKKIADALIETWNTNYGQGPGTHEHCVGGFYCWDWSRAFSQAATQAAPKSTTWENTDKGYSNKEQDVVHFAVEFMACCDRPECKLYVDDGWGRQKMNWFTLLLGRPLRIIQHHGDPGKAVIQEIIPIRLPKRLNHENRGY